MNIIKKILEPFDLPLGRLQDLRTLMIRLGESNIGMTDMITYIDTEVKTFKSESAKTSRLNSGFSICPDPNCAMPMFLYAVNDKPGNQVGGDFKSQLVCPNCMNTIYYKQSVDEFLKERRS